MLLVTVTKVVQLSVGNKSMGFELYLSGALTRAAKKTFVRDGRRVSE